MPTYKLRAECIQDVDVLLNTIRPKLYTWKIEPFVFMNGSHRVVGPPDCECEIEADMTLNELRRVIATIQDSHVMLETVAVVEDYTGERKVVRLGFLPMDARPIKQLLPSTRRSLRPR